MRGRTTRWAALLAAAAMVLAACSGDDSGAESAEPIAPGDAAPAEDVAADDGAAGDMAQAEGGGGQSAVPLAVPAAVADPDRVVKEGTVRIEVAEDGFDAAFAAVVDAARRHGGDVTASTTSTDPDGQTSGSLTVRVPVDAYEQLLVDVGDVGEVVDRRITSQDVSEEMVDLEARRRQLRVQEEFWLGLLAEAEQIDDAVRIRGELDRVQADVERISGRLAYLEDRTSFSTLTVELFEPGAPLEPAGSEPAASLAAYWATGLEALTAAVGTLIVVALGGLPLVVLAALVWIVVRALRRRPGQTVPPATSASA